jgi:hypothetical protein
MCDWLPSALELRGALRVPSALGERQLDALWSSLRPEAAVGAVRGRSQEAYGARGILSARPELRPLLAELGLDGVAGDALRRPVFPIDAVFFDKRSDANWAVPAHQDVVVPIPSEANADAVRNARHRHGLRYGEPADHVLRELVALRVHFDDAGADNGGIAIVEGSHHGGRLSDTAIRGIPAEAFAPYDCRAGDVLLMKPLAVHRSGRSALPTRRRVLHVLYAPRDGWHGRSRGSEVLDGLDHARNEGDPRTNERRSRGLDTNPNRGFTGREATGAEGIVSK